MKPVKNISKSFFGVGRCYEYENSVFRVESIRVCLDNTCSEMKCSKIAVKDMNGILWCGIEDDFHEVSLTKYRRFMNEAY